MQEEIPTILRAVNFSAEKHRTQHRKDNVSPYINHPIAVAETLARVGNVRDLDTIVAAILHDTIEDTDTTPEEISREFGDGVLSLVLEVSDDKTLRKEVRKQLQIENAPHKSHPAKLIKLADKINNLIDLTNYPPTDWPLERRVEYLNWSEKVVAGLRGANQPLEKLYDQVLENARQKLAV